MFRIAAVYSHPVQYVAPLLRELSAHRDIDLTVYFCCRHGLDATVDVGFGREVQWDIPLLAGYRSVFLPNLRRRARLDGFFGLINPAIVSELRRERYDAVWVHGYNYATHWLASIAAQVTGTPLWLRGESTLSIPRPLGVRIAKQLVLRPLIWASDACLYIGSRNRDFYEHYGARRDGLVFAPYSVDDEFFRRASHLQERGRQEFRHRLGISSDVPLILAVGKLSPKKRPLHLLRAFESLRAQRDCALVFVGDGECRADVESTYRDRGIPDVYVAGFLNQTELPAAYWSSDVLVLASGWGETWGLVVNEGMNFGLPVVVTDRVGCAGDLVRNGENGYVVAADDVAALADALDELIADPELRTRFGQRSLDIIEDFSLARTVGGIISASRGAVL